jgi:hypothetical protein
MERYCDRCGKSTFDERLVRCIHCGTLFDTFGADGSLTPSEKRVYRKVRNQVIRFVFGGFSVYALLSGFFLFHSVRDVNRTLVEKVAQKFVEPTIKATVENVAATQARGILEAQIHPEVERFKAETNASIQTFKSFTEGLESRYKADYSRLSHSFTEIAAQTTAAQKMASGLTATVTNLERHDKEYESLNKSVGLILQDLEQRKKITDLSARAINGADRAAFQELMDLAVKSNDSGVKELAASEMMRVKGFWIGASRTAGTELAKDGKTVKLNELSTCELVAAVSVSSPWPVRALAVGELGNRKHTGVPETLLSIVKSDDNLEVIKDGVIAWQTLTGYRSPDVFGQPQLAQWWNEHAVEFSKQLSAPSCK